MKGKMGVKIEDGEDLNFINLGFRLWKKGEKVEMAIAILVGNLGIGPGSVQTTPREGEKVKAHFPKYLEKIALKGGRARNPRKRC